MEIRKGIGVSIGYAIGEAFVIDREQFRITRRTVEEKDVETEIARFLKAVEACVEETRDRIEAMPRRVRTAAGSILEAQVHLFQDPVLNEDIIADIRKSRSTAEYSASRALRRRIKTLEDNLNENNKVLVQRSLTEFAEMERTLLRELLGAKREDIAHLTRKVIVVAHDLSPAQTLGLDRNTVLGFLTEVGGPTSHTAIVARSLGLPAVVGAEGVTNDISGGDTLILDGTAGTVIIDPDAGTLKRYEAQARNFFFQEEKLSREQRDLPAVTRDGVKVSILANIDRPEEIQSALEHGAEGIGLYRTEFLYLEHGYAPTEKIHHDAYRRAVQLVGDRKLTIRTMDLGADKMPLDGMPREDNPFLGTRAIRLCFQQPEILRTQLRAVLRVAPLGNVALMIPMVSSLHEIVLVREIIESVRGELRRESEPVGNGMQFGIMIEVPSAAIIADRLAPHVDFFSVGTNDLICYTVAVDRKNERVASLYQPSHPAILTLLKGVIEAGTRHGKPVSVCGEMAGDVNYALPLLGMGLRTFSVVPHLIPELKKLIRSVKMDEARTVADRAFEFDDPAATIDFLKTEVRKRLPDL
jgi:phosphotransferase system enzyme I (PtsI)